MTTTTAPKLSVVMPAWCFTQALSEMTEATLGRIQSAKSIPTEVIVVDNGSTIRGAWPCDRLIRHEDNMGIGPAYNAGWNMATGRVLAFVSNDCYVEPGWDEALVECALAGNHLAFPWTNGEQNDGIGITAWCFAIQRSLADQIGRFDPMFAPAWYEDTEFFHRCWSAGVKFWSVPAARVEHERLTTTKQAPEWGSRHAYLHWANRFRYAWKHGVPPDQQPPFWRQPLPLWPEA